MGRARHVGVPGVRADRTIPRRQGWPERARRHPRRIIARTLTFVRQPLWRPREGVATGWMESCLSVRHRTQGERALVTPFELQSLLSLMAKVLPVGARALGVFQAAAASLLEDHPRPLAQFTGPAAVPQAMGQLELRQVLAEEVGHPATDAATLVELAVTRAPRAAISADKPVCVRTVIVCHRDRTRSAATSPERTLPAGRLDEPLRQAVASSGGEEP